jgi:hypothetical protein
LSIAGHAPLQATIGAADFAFAIRVQRINYTRLLVPPAASRAQSAAFR